MATRGCRKRRSDGHPRRNSRNRSDPNIRLQANLMREPQTEIPCPICDRLASSRQEPLLGLEKLTENHWFCDGCRPVLPGQTVRRLRSKGRPSALDIFDRLCPEIPGVEGSG